MAFRAMDGFDTYAMVPRLTERQGALRWEMSGPGISLVPGRIDGLGYALEVPSASSLTAVLAADLEPGIMACALKLNAGCTLTLRFLSDGSEQYTVVLAANGDMTHYHQGNLIVTSAAVVPLNQWFYYEVEFDLQDPGGPSFGITSRLDGQESPFSGYSGGGGTSGPAAAINAPAGGRGVNRIAFVPNGAPVDVDDLVLSTGVYYPNDPQGGAAFDKIYGDRRIRVMSPSGAGSQSSWGTSATSPGAEALFALTPLPDTVGRIYAVQVAGRYRADEGGRSVSQRLLSAGQDAAAPGSTPHPLTTVAAAHSDAFTRNPATGNTWDVAGARETVNALQAGYRLDT